MDAGTDRIGRFLRALVAGVLTTVTVLAVTAAASAALPPGWHAQAVGDEPVALSCPSNAWCMAVGGTDAYVKDAGRWTGPVAVDRTGGLDHISCASQNFCAAGDRSGRIYIDRDGHWSGGHDVTGGARLTGLSCPAAGSCVAVDIRGAVMWLHGTVWTRPRAVDAGGGTPRVACGAPTACVIVDARGRALTDSGHGWSMPRQEDTGHAATSITNGKGFAAISCPQRTFCAALDNAGFVRVFNGKRWSWWNHSSLLNPSDENGVSPLGAIACSSARLCAVVGAGENQGFSGYAYLYLAVNGRWDQGTAYVNADGPADAVSCSHGGQCVALDAGGGFFQGGAQLRRWSGERIGTDAPPIASPTSIATEVACPAATTCTALTDTGYAVVEDGSGWHPQRLIDTRVSPGNVNQGGPDLFTGLSCPTAGFCAASDGSGFVFIDRGGTWSRGLRLASGGGGITALSCGSPTFCVAGDEPETSTGVARPGHAYVYNGTSWVKESALGTDHSYLADISCPTADFCGALDGAGRFLTFNGSSWSAPHAPAFGASQSYRRALTCTGPDFCLEVGHGLTPNTTGVERVTSYDGTVWSAAVTLPPRTASSSWPDSGAGNVACARAGACLVLSAANGRLYTDRGGVWSAPGNIGSQPNVAPDDQTSPLACAPSGQCVVLAADGGDPIVSPDAFTAETRLPH